MGKLSAECRTKTNFIIFILNFKAEKTIRSQRKLLLQSPFRQSSFDLLLYYFTRQTWLHPEMVLMSKLPLMEAAKIMKLTEKKSVHYC